MLAALHCACLPLSGPSGLCCLGLPATHAHVPLHCRVDRLDAEKQKEAAEVQAAAIAAQAMQDAAEAAQVAQYAAAAVGAAAAAAAMEEDAGPAAAVKLEQPGGGAVKLEQQPAATVKVEPVAAGVVKEEPRQEQPGGADQEMLAIRHPAVQRQNSKQQ